MDCKGGEEEEEEEEEGLYFLRPLLTVMERGKSTFLKETKHEMQCRVDDCCDVGLMIVVM